MSQPSNCALGNDSAAATRNAPRPQVGSITTSGIIPRWANKAQTLPASNGGVWKSPNSIRAFEFIPIEEPLPPFQLVQSLLNIEAAIATRSRLSDNRLVGERAEFPRREPPPRQFQPANGVPRSTPECRRGSRHFRSSGVMQS